jgi:hypothetical protein
MRKFIILLTGLILFSGCGSVALTEQETFLLNGIFSDFSSLRGKYEPFQRLSIETVEKGPNFMSYTFDRSGRQATPFMSSSYFWVKVSLVKNPVEASDLQQPILSMYIPRFKKYLKLRVAGADIDLKRALMAIVYSNGKVVGGQDARGPGLQPLE